MGGNSNPYTQDQKNEDKNWLSSGFGSTGSNFYKSGGGAGAGSNRPGAGAPFGGGAPMTMDRPMTAAGGNQKVRDLETQLREEQRTRKKLTEEIDSLKKDLHKASFAQF